MIRTIRFYPLMGADEKAVDLVKSGRIFLYADVVCECGKEQPFSNRCVACGLEINE